MNVGDYLSLEGENPATGKKISGLGDTVSLAKGAMLLGVATIGGIGVAQYVTSKIKGYTGVDSNGSLGPIEV